MNIERIRQVSLQVEKAHRDLITSIDGIDALELMIAVATAAGATIAQLIHLEEIDTPDEPIMEADELSAAFSGALTGGLYGLRSGECENNYQFHS